MDMDSAAGAPFAERARGFVLHDPERTACLDLLASFASRLFSLDRKQHLFLPFNSLARSLELRRRRLAVGLDASAQRIHEANDVAGRSGLFPPSLHGDVRLLLAQELGQRVLVMILEL